MFIHISIDNDFTKKYSEFKCTIDNYEFKSFSPQNFIIEIKNRDEFEYFYNNREDIKLYFYQEDIMKTHSINGIEIFNEEFFESCFEYLLVSKQENFNSEDYDNIIYYNCLQDIIKNLCITVRVLEDIKINRKNFAQKESKNKVAFYLNIFIDGDSKILHLDNMTPMVESLWGSEYLIEISEKDKDEVVKIFTADKDDKSSIFGLNKTLMCFRNDPIFKKLFNKSLKLKRYLNYNYSNYNIEVIHNLNFNYDIIQSLVHLNTKKEMYKEHNEENSEKMNFKV